MNLKIEMRKYLNDICVDLGFCLPPKEIDELISRNEYEVNQFVKEIFAIENMDPNFELQLFRQVKKMFTDRFGAQIIDPN